MKAFISAFDKRDDGMVPLRLLDCNLKYVNDTEEKSGSLTLTAFVILFAICFVIM
jgi:hypothetical protein